MELPWQQHAMRDAIWCVWCDGGEWVQETGGGREGAADEGVGVDEGRGMSNCKVCVMPCRGRQTALQPARLRRDLTALTMYVLCVAASVRPQPPPTSCLLCCRQWFAGQGCIQRGCSCQSSFSFQPHIWCPSKVCGCVCLCKCAWVRSAEFPFPFADQLWL